MNIGTSLNHVPRPRGISISGRPCSLCQSQVQVGCILKFVGIVTGEVRWCIGCIERIRADILSRSEPVFTIATVHEERRIITLA